MGKYETLVLESLALYKGRTTWWLVRDAAKALGLDKPTASIRASVCRALRNLKAAGQVVGRVQDSWEPGDKHKTIWALAGEAKRQQKAEAEQERKRQQKAEREKRKRKKEQQEREQQHARAKEPEIAKLAKILGQLGADNDNVVLTAARQAEALRKRMDVEWADILDDKMVRFMRAMNPDTWV